MPYKQKVKDIMKRNVITLSKDDTARAAAQLIVSKRIGCVIIQDEHKVPLGIVTERDLVSKIVAGNESGNVTLETIMTSPLLMISVTCTLAEASRMMTSNDIKRLPVVNRKGQLAGIISISDILRATMTDSDLTDEELLDYLSSILKIVDSLTLNDSSSRLEKIDNF
ncbi:MAG: cyclic nucleotide-binding/CBS domain-containing protein [Candidatus Hermodarchaeota archaeon]